MIKKLYRWIEKLSPNKLIVFLTLIYSPSILGFFASDDWYHLNVSNITSFREFFNFFSLTPTTQSTPFYRPISTQSFFFILHKLFGLQPQIFYLTVLLLFFINLSLLHRLLKKLTPNKLFQNLSLIIYGLSVSNFTRLYFISASQETTVAIFVLLTLFVYLRRTKKSYFSSLALFVLALMSKENAIVIPGLIFLLDWYQQKLNLKRLVPFMVIGLFYLYFRVIPSLTLPGQTYHLDFSPSKLANTLLWYGLWQVGAPELLIDYIGSGLRPIPRLYTDYPFFSYLILALLIVLGVTISYSLFINRKKLNKLTAFSTFFATIGILPVAFLPDHKYAFETAIPLIGVSVFLAQILSIKKRSAAIALIVFITLNLSMHYLTYTRHYSVKRAKLSHKVYNYLADKYPVCPLDGEFYFLDPTPEPEPFKDYARQISYAISDSNMLQVVCKNPNLVTHFSEDDPISSNKTPIKIPSKMFFVP